MTGEVDARMFRVLLRGMRYLVTEKDGGSLSVRRASVRWTPDRRTRTETWSEIPEGAVIIRRA